MYDCPIHYADYGRVLFHPKICMNDNNKSFANQNQESILRTPKPNPNIYGRNLPLNLSHDHLRLSKGALLRTDFIVSFKKR